ncbi:MULTISPECIES: Xaa-Pro dipeptidase [Halomonadaceae]|uniref:Xaa-Pro dipeptidase n=1 Tax=Modicisalibacter zincidurans TaxID=1178777 RepID=A0ABP9RIE0_9GAMM|nr:MULTISPECIES: Xaa-Pro dipeptidase [Halomonas]MCD6006981.1 Xaa-Pro dipeptidase [Halomonas sp. IOP_31]
MSETRLDDQHAAHLEGLEHAYARLLEAHGYEGVLLYSGAPRHFFGDDQQASFATFAHFLHWVPLAGIEHSWLLIRPGQRPLLRFHAPVDFWHLTPSLPQAAWTRRFTLEASDETAPPPFPQGRLAIVGDVDAGTAERLGAALNPLALCQALDELRVRKSAYEIACLREANRLALAGHEAARGAFDAGAAELDIQLAYLKASRQRESQVPYQNIVGLNEHAGVLHYQHYDIQPAVRRHSLLLDAGRRVAGYASDITRTWAGRDADPQFAALIEGVERFQQRLIAELRPGVDYVALHAQMHLELGRLLSEQALIECSPEAAVESGITRAFCPHGLGHSLGLQVHDVAGRRDARGEPLPAPERDPALRLTRPLEAGMVITMEPGLYIIPMLLEPLRDQPAGRHIDWPGVTRLAPHGGIRIEDDIAIGHGGPINLTRDNATDSL